MPRTIEGHPFHLTPRQALEELWPRAKVLLSNADGVLVRGLSGLESDPEGRINVPEAQRFYINGYVRNPGYYVLDPGMTVEQAIALAGGLSDRGSTRGLAATRMVNGKRTEVSLKLDDKVQANDTIAVKQRLF